MGEQAFYIIPFSSHNSDEQHAAVDDENINDEEFAGEGIVVNVGVGYHHTEENGEDYTIKERIAHVLVAHDAFNFQFNIFTHLAKSVELFEFAYGLQLGVAIVCSVKNREMILHIAVDEEVKRENQ